MQTSERIALRKVNRSWVIGYRLEIAHNLRSSHRIVDRFNYLLVVRSHENAYAQANKLNFSSKIEARSEET
jgi:hypothetical protein